MLVHFVHSIPYKYCRNKFDLWLFNFGGSPKCSNNCWLIYILMLCLISSLLLFFSLHEEKTRNFACFASYFTNKFALLNRRTLIIFFCVFLAPCNTIALQYLKLNGDKKKWNGIKNKWWMNPVICKGLMVVLIVCMKKKLGTISLFVNVWQNKLLACKECET